MTHTVDDVVRILPLVIATLTDGFKLHVTFGHTLRAGSPLLPELDALCLRSCWTIHTEVAVPFDPWAGMAAGNHVIASLNDCADLERCQGMHKGYDFMKGVEEYRAA